MNDPKNRFSDRVENYVKYRPSYPREIGDFLARQLGFKAGDVVADVGSGTGIFSQFLLDLGAKVLAVEPNEFMRQAAEKMLGGYSEFSSIAGSAEQTTLPSASADFITDAQAFHWCDPERSRQEFSRVLKPRGAVVLIWNSRKETGNGFNVEYEALISKYGTDYHQIKHSNTRVNGSLEKLWSGDTFKTAVFQNAQQLDLDGLRGRLLSSSYIPKEDDSRFQTMLEALKALFDRHKKNETIEIQYDTEVFYGALS